MTRSSHFAKRAYSRRAEIFFHYQSGPAAKPLAKLEAAYHIGDVAIHEPIDQLAAYGIAERQVLHSAGRKIKTPGNGGEAQRLRFQSLLGSRDKSPNILPSSKTA